MQFSTNARSHNGQISLVLTGQTKGCLSTFAAVSTKEILMISIPLSARSAVAFAVLPALLALAGCASTGEKSTGSQTSKFKMDDGRTVNIGRATAAPGGGTNYKSPHLDNVWLANGFDFNGYDTL